MDKEDNLTKYSKPSEIGLRPIGNTSYLNAALQCIGNIYELAEYFLKKSNQSFFESNIKKMPLSFAIGRLFIHIYPYPEKEEKSPYGNESILGVLGFYNQTFNSINKRDIKDLINLIFEKLHDELNSIKNSYNIINSMSYDKFNIKASYINQIDFFYNNNKSIISYLFTFFIKKEYHCSFCKKTKCDYIHFNTFDLDIFECANNSGSGNISIYDCLNYFTACKCLNFFCQNCKKQTKTNIISKIYDCPNIFTFLLRSDLEKGNLIKFKIEKKINLKNYVENKNTSEELELIGIISVFGEKYVSFSKSSINSRWYFYNDENVKFMDIDIIIEYNNNLNQYIPCILFYKLINDNENQ